MTAEPGRVFLLSAGRRAAFRFELRHERSGVWETCAASQLFCAAENVARSCHGGFDVPNAV